MNAVATHFGWIEILLSALIAFGFGGYQLWSVNREIARDRAKREADRSKGSAPGPGHPVGEHELDDR